jgi:hypothetical protein
MRNTLLYLLLFISISSCKKGGTADEPSVNISDGSWRISYFWDQQDKTSGYTSYYFMFLNGGTLMAHGSSTTLTGTWSQTGSRININFTNAPLNELNGDWLKTEFMGTSIKLKDDSPSQDDQLYFVKN